MRPRLLISVLFVAGLLAVTASGQPAQVGGSGKKIEPPPIDKDKKAARADPTDAQVAAALAHDPDVKIAQAKVQLAEAEVSKAREAVVLKVLTLVATIKEQKSLVSAHQENVAMTVRRVEAGAEPLATLIAQRAKLESAQGMLAKAETELKLLTGGIGGKGWWSGSRQFRVEDLVLPTDQRHARAAERALELLDWSLESAREAGADGQAARFAAWVDYLRDRGEKGPIPERIRSALNKPVKLGARGEQITFSKAMETFKKEAGLDVPVREIVRIAPVTSEGEELPVGAWFQMFADGNPDVRFLVREYGLLVTLKDVAPPDALTVVEFWKRPVRKDPEVKTAPTSPQKK